MSGNRGYQKQSYGSNKPQYTPSSASSINDAGMTRSTKDWSSKPQKKLPDFGLASKGDNRLTDFKTQESFFKQIQQRYIFHCGSFPDVSSLDAQFSALSVNSNIDDPSRPFVKDVDTSILESILVDMRKLREGLLASKRIDEFTTGVYIFITRAAILMSHSQSYVPSLRYLLYNIHSVRPLSNPEINEFASYLMLHLACSTQAYHDAYEIKTRFRVHDFRAEAVVKSLVTGNYWLFWSTKKLVDGYKARIMEKAEKRIRTDILKVVGKSYMQVDVDFLQNITAREWPILREEFGIGWEEEAKMIYIRRAKTKSTPITSEAAKVAAQKTMNNDQAYVSAEDSWTKYG